MQQWEYMMVQVGIHLSAILKVARWDLELEGTTLRSEAEVTAYFNRLGAEGWEMITLIGGSDANGNITKLVFYFKRPKAG